MHKTARRRVVKRLDFQGLEVAIEFPKGSKRPYTDDAGVERLKTMHADYGEVRGTKGLDGDAVDIYVGPEADSDRVFVITQMKRGDWKKIDEEKCILGTSSAKEARQLYLSHYNDSRFCGAIKEMSMDQFKEKLATKGVAGKKIASTAQRIAELNYLRLQQNEPVLIDGRHGVKVALGGSGTEDIAADVKAEMARRDPSVLEALWRYQGEPPDVTKMEQLGLGIPRSEVKENPKDSKLRKAAAALQVDAFTKSAKSHLAERVAVLGGGAAGAIGAHELAKRHGHRVLGYQPSRGQLGTALVLGGVGGAQLVRAALRDLNKHAAASGTDRFSRIADRVDDVGIGMLAAPYALKEVGHVLGKRRGVLGAVGAGASRWGNALSNEHSPLHRRMELGGLALVAPGITHGVAKRLDRRLPAPKVAGLGATTLRLGQKLTQAGTGAVRKGTRLGALGLAAAGVGLGAGAVAARRALGHEHAEGLAAPAYQPPRLF